MDYEMLDYQHSIGNVPDKFYYQLYNKSADQNYREQKRKIYKSRLGDSFLEDFIMNMMKATLQTALEEIMDIIIP